MNRPTLAVMAQEAMEDAEDAAIAAMADNVVTLAEWRAVTGKVREAVELNAESIAADAAAATLRRGGFESPRFIRLVGEHRQRKASHLRLVVVNEPDRRPAA